MDLRIGSGSSVAHAQLYLINDIASDLWGKYSKIVGQKYKEQPEEESSSVLSEIDIERAQFLHPARRYRKGTVS